MTDLDRLVSHIHSGRRFLVSSHQRPDGDAIGSAVGFALALRELGKQAEVVMDAVPPHFLRPFPAVDQIRVTTTVDETTDGSVIMECSSLDRTGVSGLDRSPVLNIDHHVGNTRYGAINWVDESAAACTELVFTLVETLGVKLTPDIATHLYLGLLTDTGSFRFSHITPRSFEIARRCVDAGANPQWIARTHYDSNTLGRVRLFGRVLNTLRLEATGRVALLTMTLADAAAAGATYDDTDGLINFPLSVKDIQAVAFFKETGPDDWRVSMRSKGDVNVGAIARAHGGGGHANAAGCSARGQLTHLQDTFLALLVKATSV
ncbi:MAG TPA: bifunctional oligoribonuclease/PAP phosphatase NrnA [Vicinamibacterales bacterium]|nr:bifunctional oligoribonuclease/PAP phosphatase NrnA [Vicinamibacterales bacterium]